MTAPLAYSVRDAAAATGLSKSYLDRAIRACKLKARRSSEDADGNPTGSRVILAADLHAFLDALPEDWSA